MEQASGRSRVFGPSSSSAQAQEVESPDEEEDVDYVKEEIEKLRKDVEEIKLQQAANYAGICDQQYRAVTWQNKIEDWQFKIEKKMDDQHAEIIRYLQGNPPSPPSD